MADDLGWQNVGYMGARYFETSNIDQLAADGMTFSRAYAREHILIHKSMAYEISSRSLLHLV